MNTVNVEKHSSNTTEPADFTLGKCLPPSASEFDQSNLMALAIDARTLAYSKNEPERNQFTIVNRAIWTTHDNTKKNVVVKGFLSLINRWASLKSNALVTLLGVTSWNTVSMVSEYLPMGQLDHYLKNANSGLPIKEAHLVEAAAHLSNALWYMEEASFVHGNIRCRKVLVSSHTENSFAVKLSDPGLHKNYTDADLHWIPPEHQNEDPNKARNSVAADVWAFATTLWEIFSWGKSPPLTDASEIKEFYKSGKMLPKPIGCPGTVYDVMKECWNNETDHRKSPQAVMRDINQIFYQEYKRWQDHSYTTTTPSTDGQQHNVSDKSKENEDLSSRLFSELKVTTLADDGEEICSLMPIFCPFKSSLGDRNSASSNTQIFEVGEWQLIVSGRTDGEVVLGDVFESKEMLQHRNEEYQQHVAIKKFKTRILAHANLADFDREISILKKLDHPNIVKLIGIIRHPELNLISEFIDGGSLKSYLEINRYQLRTCNLLKYALDVASGMAYLSEKKIVHRDLAARNILVVNDTHVKISDFAGLAQIIDNDNYYKMKTEKRWPMEWFAPESIQYGNFSTQSDVWSYGVTLYEIFTHGEDPRLLLVDQQNVDDMLNVLKNNNRLNHCSSYVYSNIMRECWQYEAAKRPTFQILTSQFEALQSR